MIVKACHCDIKQVTTIHLREFKEDFLPSLGREFLEQLYLGFINKGESLIFLWKNKEIKGFIFGCTDFSNLFKKTIKEKFFFFFKLLLPRILEQPTVLTKILETFLYTLKTKDNKTEAELVVIAIDKLSQNKGIGTKLLKKFENELLKRGIKQYKVSTIADNLAANNFYQKNNFLKKKQFRLYNKIWNLYFKNISK